MKFDSTQSDQFDPSRTHKPHELDDERLIQDGFSKLPEPTPPTLPDDDGCTCQFNDCAVHGYIDPEDHEELISSVAMEPTPPTETQKPLGPPQGQSEQVGQSCARCFHQIEAFVQICPEGGICVAAPTERVETTPELITDEEIEAASKGGEYPKLIAWTRVIQRMRLAEAAMMTLEAAVAPSPIAYKCRSCNMTLTEKEKSVWVGCDVCEGDGLVRVQTDDQDWERVAGSIIDTVHMTSEDYVNEKLVEQLKRYFAVAPSPAPADVFWPCRENHHKGCACQKFVQCACECHKLKTEATHV